MRHLIPFTKDQISIIETSLEASLKYADSEYIESVNEIIKETLPNTAILALSSMIIAVFMGEFNSGGYSTTITKIEQENNQFIIHIQETQSGKNCG